VRSKDEHGRGDAANSLSLSGVLGAKQSMVFFSNKIGLQKQQNDKTVGCSNLNINFLITSILLPEENQIRNKGEWYGIMGAKHPILTAIKNRRKEMVVVFCSNKQITT
jgi:hypothetical protein